MAGIIDVVDQALLGARRRLPIPRDDARAEGGDDGQEMMADTNLR